MKKILAVVTVVAVLSLSACHNIFKPVPPGHDPDGPGNSENTPARN